MPDEMEDQKERMKRIHGIISSNIQNSSPTGTTYILLTNEDWRIVLAALEIAGEM